MKISDIADTTPAGNPTKNSLGKLIHPTEDGINNFWKWFKNSKVVDSSGRPLVVYHGSPYTENISKFDLEYAGKGNDSYGPGFYFTNNPVGASGYSGPSSDKSFDLPTSPGVTPCYLSLQRPYILNERFSEWEITPRQAEKLILQSPGIFDMEETRLWDHIDLSRHRQVEPWMVRKIAGVYTNVQTIMSDFHIPAKIALPALVDITRYDGVIFSTAGSVWYDEGTIIFVAFKPSSIKSAVGNTGKFSSRTDNITETID